MAVNRDYAKNYFLGGGELYVRFPEESNFRYFGATESVSLNFTIDKVEHQSSEGAMLVTDLEVTKSVSAELTIQTADLNPKVLALAFSGDYIETTQTSGSATADFTAVVAGAVYELGKYKVKNVVVKYTDDNGDEQTAVENVDYSVDYDFGAIEIATDGVLVGRDITVDFDYDSYTTGKFTSLNQTSKELALRFISKPLHGKPSKTDIHRVILNLDGDFNLKSAEDIQKITLKGKVLQDDTKPEGEKFLVKEVLV